MKDQNRDGVVIDLGVPITLAAPINLSPFSQSYIAPQTPVVPTPSPLTFSAASTRLSSWRPSVHISDLVLRLLGLVLSFVSALSIAVPSSSRKRGERQGSSFSQYPELVYCFVVAVSAFLYSAFQLFKGVCDIAHRGMIMSDMVSDYISFIIDEIVGYLLISSSTVAIPLIRYMDEDKTTLKKAAIVSVCMSFSSFSVLAISGLLSGYKLCKRIIW